MSGPHMTVYVTHVDDSVRGRLEPCLNFWGMMSDRICNLQTMNMYIEIIQPILKRNPPPLHPSDLVDQICCVLINQRWLRARVIDLQLNPTGSLEVFCVDSGATHSVPLSFLRTLDIPGPEAECVREWVPLATRYILADVVSPQTYAQSMQKVFQQWSDSAMVFLKIHVENCYWKAVCQGHYGRNQCLRLFDDSNQLLASKMIQQDLAVAAPTYLDALSSCKEKDLNPNFVKPLNALSAGFNFSQQPQFVMPQNSHKPPRAYVTVDFPGNGRHDVIVISILEGPFKFTIQRSNDVEEFKILRKKIESVVLYRFLGSPSLGAPCIAINPVNKLPHRGLITHLASSNQLSVYFVDMGTTEMIDIFQLYEISDELVAAHLTVSRVSLIGAEEVAKLPGIHQIFTAMVNESLFLQCQVVENDGKLKINLYDHTGRSFIDILLAMYSIFRPISLTSVPSRPGLCQSHKTLSIDKNVSTEKPQAQHLIGIDSEDPTSVGTENQPTLSCGTNLENREKVSKSPPTKRPRIVKDDNSETIAKRRKAQTPPVHPSSRTKNSQVSQRHRSSSRDEDDKDRERRRLKESDRRSNKIYLENGKEITRRGRKNDRSN